MTLPNTTPKDFVPCDSLRPQSVDYTGLERETFVVLGIAGHAGKDRRSIWRCRCTQCGREVLLRSNHLVGKARYRCSCVTGTVGYAPRVAGPKPHGMSHTSEYKIWSGIKTRCYNPNSEARIYYSGRGVVMCERWLLFENFLADMGPRPSADHTIDRYPDQDGNYEPGNCRWATRTGQAQNRRSNTLLTWNGETKTQSEWVRITGIPQSTLSQRILHLGWSVARALSTPARKHRSHAT